MFLLPSVALPRRPLAFLRRILFVLQPLSNPSRSQHYDPVFQQVRQASGTGRGERYGALMRAVEARLKPCLCGGVFCHDAPRRCFRCHTPVISENPDGIDLFPEWMDGSLPDVLSEQAEHWTAQFVRAKDIWQEVHL